MRKKFNLFIIMSLILGIVAGLLIPNIMRQLEFIGTIYINLLKFLIIPILLTTIITTIYKTIKGNSKLIFKTVLTFIIMFIISFLITALIVSIINPSNGFNLKIVEWNSEIEHLKFSEVIINLFPSNMVLMLQNNSIFATIIFSIFFGICTSKVKNGNKVIEVIEGLKNIFNKLLEYIMYLTPIAIFSLIGVIIANYGAIIISESAKYIGIAYLCSVIVMILVMIMPVWIICKINPINYMKKIYKIWIITLTTCSSSATLPYTIKVCNNDLKIPSKITDIVVPLGCTIHMCGGAVSFALLGIFCSSLFGIEITFINFLIMMFSALFINMAAPGIPNGGIVIGATYLSMLGIPLSFIGLYSGIYKILDMSYTTLNVTGDITANILINHYYKKKGN